MPNFTPDFNPATIVAAISAQADRAEDEADRAEVEADRSEAQAGLAAALVALQGVFDDTAAGIAGTSVGQTFGVPIEGGVGFYRHDAGPVAVQIATLVGTARVIDLENALFDNEDYIDSIFRITARSPSGARKMPFNITPDGTAEIYKLRFKQLSGEDYFEAFALTCNGKIVASFDWQGRLNVLRHNERFIDTSADDYFLRYVWSLVNENHKSPLYVLREGRAGIVPDQATLDRFATGLGTAAPDLATISTALLPGNLSAPSGAPKGLVRALSDRSGVFRSYVARRVDPPVWIEEGRNKMRWVQGTGDSLSQGSGGETFVTPGTPEPNTVLMLPTGIRSLNTGSADTDAFNPASVSDFAPAQEALSGVLGETGWVAYGRQREMLQRAAGAPRTVSVVRTSGFSGKRLPGIRQETLLYQNGIAEATRARDIARDVYGREMECRSVFIRNGTNDRSLPDTLLNYKAGLIELQSDYTADMSAVFGTSHQVGLWQVQIGAPKNPQPNGIEISQAQLEAAEEVADIHLFSPAYQFTYAPGENVHLDAGSYAMICELAAIAEWRRERYGASVFVPMPRRAEISVAGNVVTVPFDLVSDDAGGWHGLTFSTADRVAATMQGFRITGAAQTVTGVGIGASGTPGIGVVQVTLSGAPSVGATLEYASEEISTGTSRPSAWGNLCSTWASPSLSVPSKNLRHYAPVFRKVL